MKIAFAPQERDWRFVPELLRFVGPEEQAVIEAIRLELSHPDWLGKVHGQRKLYARGCTGPLCKKAARDYGRKYMRTARESGSRHRRTRAQHFDPLLEMFHKAYLTSLARRIAVQAGTLSNAQKGRELVDAAAR